MALVWQVFRNLAFMKGTGWLTGFRVLRGEWLSLTNVINLLVNQYLSSKSSKISPAWYGAEDMSFLYSFISKCLY